MDKERMDMKELKTFEWDKLNDKEYQEAIDYNCNHGEDILEYIMDDIKSKRKFSRILCKFGHHNYKTTLIALILVCHIFVIGVVRECRWIMEWRIIRSYKKRIW